MYIFDDHCRFLNFVFFPPSPTYYHFRYSYYCFNIPRGIGKHPFQKSEGGAFDFWPATCATRASAWRGVENWRTGPNTASKYSSINIPGDHS